MEEASSRIVFLVALGAASLMGLAVTRWGRRGALVGYLVGLVVCLLAWTTAVFFSTRLSGSAPDALGPALGRSLAAVVVLSGLWLVVASCGVVAGALARLVVRRRRARRHSPPIRSPEPQPRRSRGPGPRRR
ncbi:hypothetical protein [Phenylobacterium deserti]|uniref:Uncharacterized protein n=1 Tax=Phenylobacterium deserti TaxID=1914756 RepID=A0A328ADY0_9CAUL|nr:hypothetical protein [Phenylobacterium deserti]RAK50958.1 hypothetical protein DJ018_17510 [Phenylobacterium deserti]